MIKAIAVFLVAIETASAASDCYSQTRKGQSVCLTSSEAGEHCAWCHSASSGDSCMKESDASGLPTTVFQCTYQPAIAVNSTSSTWSVLSTHLLIHSLTHKLSNRLTLIFWHTSGGNCPGGCATCPCGNRLYPVCEHMVSEPSPSCVALPAVARSNHRHIRCSKYSWNQAHCQCIMNAESRGNGKFF